MCKNLHLQTVEQSQNNVAHCDLQNIISSTSSQILEESLCAGSTLGWNQCIRTSRHQRMQAARRAAHTCRLQLHHSEKKPHDDGHMMEKLSPLDQNWSEVRENLVYTSVWSCCVSCLQRVSASSLIQDLFTAPPTWTTPTSAFINIRAQRSVCFNQSFIWLFDVPLSIVFFCVQITLCLWLCVWLWSSCCRLASCCSSTDGWRTGKTGNQMEDRWR